jgi:hypothetical protein
MYAKQSLRWQDAPINIDLSTQSLGDYEAIVSYLRPLVELLRHTPADSSGLRWRYLDGSVLFEFSRIIPVSYDDFVARVDISKAIQFMTDYIGGMAVPVARDRTGRVTHQAERNLYLPQPNYLAMYQGKVIDVTKLEFVQYEDDRQQIFWKTLKSENHSATFDDGIVTFTRTGENETAVSVFGRQQFALPLFFQIFNIDLNPWLKDLLVTHAYTTFFSQTLSNFEAKYEGREIRIGRPWNPVEGEEEAASKSHAERLAEVANKVGEVVTRGWTVFSNSLPSALRFIRPGKNAVDEDGFTHGKGTGSRAEAVRKDSLGFLDPRKVMEKACANASELVADIAQAMRKDLGLYREDD